MIIVVGSDGSQGRRYSAILDHLGKRWMGIDIHTPSFRIRDVFLKADGIIIATPTITHAPLIREYLKYRVPILCEKPITKDIVDLRKLIKEIKDSCVSFSMISQYRQLLQLCPLRKEESHYNYFKHGSDGLVWDCLQIIGLAEGRVTLDETSPIWSCAINGQELNISHMDQAYIKEVKGWLQREPRLSLDQILQWHEKVVAFEAGAKYHD